MYNTILCMLALTELFYAPNGKPLSQSYVDRIGSGYEERLEVCHEVAHKAEAMGIKPTWAIALAYEESRFDRDKISGAGAVGPLQVLPSYSNCQPNKPCDWISQGLIALKYWMDRYPKKWVCHYNSGNSCNKNSIRFARRVSSRRHRLYTQLRSITFNFEP